MKVVRTEGPTPAGGAYAEAIVDDRGRVLEITEYAADGTVVMRTYSGEFGRRMGGDEADGALSP